MKITAFNGSPRGQGSNTAIMVSEFLAGASAAGAETEQIFLSQKKIDHCRGCFRCWIETPGKCVLVDDMTILLQKVMSSELVILATPLYIDDVTGIMKGFMDRLIPLMDPHFEQDENGEWRHVKRFSSYPDIAVISNCGMPGRQNFQALQLHISRMARNFHSRVTVEIYQDCGELLKNQILILKPVISRYKKLLRKAGGEVATEGSISLKIKEKLEKSLISGDMFIKEANKFWDRQLSKLDKDKKPE